MDALENNITHNCDLISSSEIKDAYINKICKRGDLPYATVDEQIFLIEEMLRSDLGRFILKHRGANGYWTDILVNTPSDAVSTIKSEGNVFEEFLLSSSPVVLAHRERFKLFQEAIQSALQPMFSLASVPCGVMRDLLTLDFSNSQSCKLTGIDIDSESLELASQLAQSLGSKNELCFYQKDAWRLEFRDEFDIITSSGLNVYEPSRIKTVNLYKSFLQALRPGGLLVTSVLTFPPFSDSPSDWETSAIPEESLRLERLIHHDILGVKWKNYRSINDLKTDFLSAGFARVEVVMDSRKIFPTILAYK